MIEVEHFTKRYGDFMAVDDLNLSIGEGEIYGFIGPNGAGKSTTIRFLATLLKPTSGEGRIAGHSVTNDPMAVRRVIGFMPDDFGVYDGMKVWEFLDFFAVAYEIPRLERRRIIGEVLQLLDLTHKRDDYVNGLEMKYLLNELRRMGKTILVSSHILSELADFCTSIGVIERGKLLASGSIQDIQKQLRSHRVLKVRILNENPAQFEYILKNHSSVKAQSVNTIEGTLSAEFEGDGPAQADLLRQMMEAGAIVEAFDEEQISLEDVFMMITKGIVN